MNQLDVYKRQVLPVVCAASFLILNYTIFPHKISILGSKGIVDLINGILQILSGFYIASLAAIATASLPRLDEPMKGATPLYICLLYTSISD